jgi:HK97 family phage major capsid protein
MGRRGFDFLLLAATLRDGLKPAGSRLINSSPADISLSDTVSQHSAPSRQRHSAAEPLRTPEAARGHFIRPSPKECPMEQNEYLALTKSIEKNIGSFGDRIAAVQVQVDAIDKRLADKHGIPGSGFKSLRDHLKENESVQRIVRDKRGTAVLSLSGDDVISALERKTIISSGAVGWQTTGVLPIERIPGITAEARATLRVRDVLAQTPTSLQVVDFVKVTTPMTIASPQVESSPKAENAVAFTSYSERVKTIATWIPASKQILDDFQELGSYLESALPYYVNLAEEMQLLSGDGTGENLHGILVQATGFNSGLLPPPAAGWTRIDVIGHAIQQINQSNEIPPTFVMLNPKDYWALRLTKDSYGRYLLGDPQMLGNANVFGLDAVMTPSMPVSQFLVGTNSAVAAEIRDRMQMQIELSSEHMDYFVRNLIAIRAEKRLALVVKRGASFISGMLNSSPVS